MKKRSPGDRIDKLNDERFDFFYWTISGFRLTNIDVALGQQQIFGQNWFLKNCKRKYLEVG